MHAHSRRQFLQGSLAVAALSLVAGCGVAPPQARPAEKVHRVGFLSNDPPTSPPARSNHEAFRDGLRDLGYVEGQNLSLEWRFSEGASGRLPELATELVALNPDVIAVGGDPAIRALKSATSTIPIVITLSADPVASGYVASLARPGGNITGLSLAGAQLAGKRLGLLKETFPAVSRVGVLWAPSGPEQGLGSGAQPLQFRETEVAAQALGVQVQSLAVRGPDDFDAAVEAAVQGRAEALIVIPSGPTSGQGARIADFAAKHRLPTMFGAREHVVDVGGLMAYGPSTAALHRRAADYVDKILKGAKPADLPVEQPTTFDFVISLKAAQVLGLTIPPSVLVQATEVIE